MVSTDAVFDLVAPVASSAGAELVDVEFNGGVLRLVVDSVDGPDTDTIATISRQASVLLDDLDPVPGRYTLEVSSPGLERSLRRPAHFVAAVGERVTVKTRVDGAVKRLVGALRDADDAGVTIEVDGADRAVGYGDVISARTVFDWGPAPKPGSSKRKGSR